MSGPLEGIRVLEFGALGPAPFAAMTLADMGATVTRIVRPGKATEGPGTFMSRGKNDVEVDLKTSEGIALAKQLAQDSDVLIEGFRPGRMEALGLGPEDLFEACPDLIYGRITGWGREGPLANMAGHDINFLSISGVLSLLGTEGSPPPPPLNLVADFGGGGMYLAFGIVCALYSAARGSRGQVVDASMLQGTTHLAMFVHAQKAAGKWTGLRASNLVDGGAPFYRTYETEDGLYMAVGSIEPQFFAELLSGLGLLEEFKDSQWQKLRWPELEEAIRSVFKSKPRSYWQDIFDDADACVTPVLSLDEAHQHPHLSQSFVLNSQGELEPASTPSISRLDQRRAKLAQA